MWSFGPWERRCMGLVWFVLVCHFGRALLIAWMETGCIKVAFVRLHRRKVGRGEWKRGEWKREERREKPIPRSEPV